MTIKTRRLLAYSVILGLVGAVWLPLAAGATCGYGRGGHKCETTTTTQQETTTTEQETTTTVQDTTTTEETTTTLSDTTTTSSPTTTTSLAETTTDPAAPSTTEPESGSTLPFTGISEIMWLTMVFVAAASGILGFVLVMAGRDEE